MERRIDEALGEAEEAARIIRRDPPQGHRHAPHIQRGNDGDQAGRERFGQDGTGDDAEPQLKPRLAPGQRIAGLGGLGGDQTDGAEQDAATQSPERGEIPWVEHPPLQRCRPWVKPTCGWTGDEPGLPEDGRTTRQPGAKASVDLRPPDGPERMRNLSLGGSAARADE